MHFAPKMHFDPMKREQATAILEKFYQTKLRFQEKNMWALSWENQREE